MENKANKNNKKVPDVIGKGYKLFEQDSEGNLYALFIDKKCPVPIGEWIEAKFTPTKGFASRGGWHLGITVPDSPWLKKYNGTEYGTYGSTRSKYWKRVWCEVEYNATNDYNSEVEQLPGKCFSDKCPENGYYFFREVGRGTWVITSDIKINRIISDKERVQIMAEQGYDEVGAYRKYKEAMEKRMETMAAKKEGVM